MDAISHVLEFYFDGTPSTTVQDEIGEGLIRAIIQATEILVQHPKDYEARAQLAWSATLALCGLTGTGTSGGDWAGHLLEHSLSALYDVAHGAGLAIILPAWMRYVYRRNLPQFTRFARQVFAVGEPDEERAALAGIEALKSWYAKVGAPVSLQEVDIPAADIDKIVANAALLAPLGRLQPLEAKDLREILQLAR